MNETVIVLERVSIQGGIALLAVYLLSRLLPRLPADLRCWLWRTAYLKCLVGLFLAVRVSVPILPRAASQQMLPTPAREPFRESNPAPMPPKESVSMISEEVNSVIPTDASTDIPISGFTSSVVPIGTDKVVGTDVPIPLWRFYLVLFYATGIAMGIIRLGIAALQTRRLVRNAVSIEHAAVAELSRRFGRSTSPRIARSAEITTPLLAFGMILLPEETSGDESLILGHELAHLRRNDLAWEWLGILTQIVLWFHPLVYLARNAERLAREQAADALTLARTDAMPADYARTLLQASLCRSRPVPALAVGAVESGTRLRSRLEAIAAPALTRRRAFTLGTVAVLLATLAFIPGERSPAKVPFPYRSVPRKTGWRVLFSILQGNRCREHVSRG